MSAAQATACITGLIERQPTSRYRTSERFFAEVRIAPQVSHPDVCRVCDVAQIDG